MERKNLAARLLETSRAISANSSPVAVPPSETPTPPDQPVLAQSLFKDTRGYLKQVVSQVNLCYTNACYDGCMVMVRRLVEVLLIETFEHKKVASEIKDGDGNYYFLKDLIAATLKHTDWSIGREAKKGLGKLKTVGDRSAHSRRYNARREDVDAVIIDLRAVAEDLLYLSGLRT